MLKTLSEGYIPCLIVAVIGYNFIGGSLFSWAAFIWIFGAILTVATAYAKVRTVGFDKTENTEVSSSATSFT